MGKLTFVATSFEKVIEGLKWMKIHIWHFFFMKHSNIFHIPSKKFKNSFH